jgi:hypothetical protein
MNRRNFINTTVAFLLTFIAITTERSKAHPAYGEKENETSTEGTEDEILNKFEGIIRMGSKDHKLSNGISEISALPFDISYYQLKGTERIAQEFTSKRKNCFFELIFILHPMARRNKINEFHERLIRSATPSFFIPKFREKRYILSVANDIVMSYGYSLRTGNKTSDI